MVSKLIVFGIGFLVGMVVTMIVVVLAMAQKGE